MAFLGKNRENQKWGEFGDFCLISEMIFRLNSRIFENHRTHPTYNFFLEMPFSRPKIEI